METVFTVWLTPWINGVGFSIDLETERVTFIFDVSEPVDIVERLQEIQKVIIQAVNLIKLFEEKGFIITVRTSQQFDNPFIWGRFIIGSPTIPYDFPDIRISELITKYSTQEIFVTPELNKFIEDGFITREEVRANRQWFTTRNALRVAIVALSLSVIFNILNIFSRNSNNTTNPNTEQTNKSKNSNIKNDTTIVTDTTMVVKTITIVTIIKTDTIRK